MTFGNPVLLSVNENKLTTALLSRVAMKNDVYSGPRISDQAIS